MLACSTTYSKTHKNAPIPTWRRKSPTSIPEPNLADPSLPPSLGILHLAGLRDCWAQTPENGSSDRPFSVYFAPVALIPVTDAIFQLQSRNETSRGRLTPTLACVASTGGLV